MQLANIGHERSAAASAAASCASFVSDADWPRPSFDHWSMGLYRETARFSRVIEEVVEVG